MHMRRHALFAVRVARAGLVLAACAALLALVVALCIAGDPSQ